MKQLRLLPVREGISSQIEIEARARQEVTVIMAEMMVAIVQAEKEERDERVEES